MTILKISLKVGAPIAVVALSALGTLLLLRFYATTIVYENPKLTAPSTVVKTDPIVPVSELPVRLKIPRIHVDAAIESLGLTSEGDLAAPEGPDNTGWYNVGPRPGTVGSAVIDGHYGWSNNKPAAFDNLHTLQKGDLVYVEDGKGGTHKFGVSELRTFGPEDDASAIFLSSDGKAHLNLITCQGAWNKQQKSYATRLVVFADLMTE